MEGRAFRGRFGGFSLAFAKTKLNDISSLKDDIHFVYERIKNFKNIDVSHLDGPLQSLFSKAEAYDDAGSSTSENLSKKLLKEQLHEARHHLAEAQTKEAKYVDHIKSSEEELQSIRKELKALKHHRKNVSTNLKSQEELLESTKMDIRTIEDKIDALGKKTPLTDEVMKILNTSKEYLASAQEELKNTKIFP